MRALHVLLVALLLQACQSVVYAQNSSLSNVSTAVAPAAPADDSVEVDGAAVDSTGAATEDYAEGEEGEDEEEEEPDIAGVGFGGVIFPLQYSSNLQFISTEVLPVGWKLNAVMKWDAYGHGIENLVNATNLTNATKLANATGAVNTTNAINATAPNPSVSVRYNSEAVAATALPKPVILRIRPANYSEVVEAVRLGLGVQELVAPSNLQDVVAAGKDTNTSIPVHIFLYIYNDLPWGWTFRTSTELQELVTSLDPRYVTVAGIMMHLSSFTDEEKPVMVQQFTQVVCPVAAALAPKPVALHYAASDDVLLFIPDSGTRMVPPGPPADHCTGPNIEWWARIGKLAYGLDAEANSDLSDGTAPVFLWSGALESIGPASGVNGSAQRQTAVVNIGPLRYPSPSWWSNVTAFNPTPAAMDASAGGAANATTAAPEAFVYIDEEEHQLAEVPGGNASLIVVDLTGANPLPALEADVCVVCAEHPLQQLALEVGADAYNVALCLEGKPPQEGTNFPTPNCTPPAANATAV